jgi:predicted permease
MRGIWRDLAFGARAWSRRPGATAATVLALAGGIAATSLAFSLLNALFLRPLPVHEPERIVRVYSRYAAGFQHFTLSYPDYVDIRDMTDIFSGVLAEEPVPFSLSTGGPAVRVYGQRVAGGYFSVLGLQPEAGRFTTAAEEESAEGVGLVVISHDLWRRQFGGRREAVGERVRLNGRPCEVVGVAPRGFTGTTPGVRSVLWRPAAKAGGGSRMNRGHFAAARLRPGTTTAQAEAALDALASRLQRQHPGSNSGVRFAMLPESASRVHPLARGGALGLSGALLAAAGLLLLLACANAAAVLLASALERRREIGIRAALGASRGCIVRQFLAEALALAAMAGAAGVLVAAVVARALGAIELPTRIPVSFDFGADARVLAFSVAITAASVLVFGVAPSVRASRVDAMTLIRRSRDARMGRRRPGSALIGGQVALTMLLMTTGGLFLRSLLNARAIDPGFDPRGVATATVDVGLHGYSSGRALVFWRRLVERVAHERGMAAVSLASAVPFELNINQMSVGPEGFQPTREGGWPSIDWTIVDAGYFRAMRMPLLGGRDFGPADREGAPAIAIVNGTLARRFWPDGNAVGRRLAVADGSTLEVVGVVATSRQLSLGEPPRAHVFLPIGQAMPGAMTVVARTELPPAEALGLIRDAVSSLDPDLPIYNATTMEGHVAVALLPAQGGAIAIGIMGAVALLLSALGLYGTVAHTVGRRTHEIGVRRALGATSSRIMAVIVGHTALMAAGGTAAGGLLAALLAPGLARMLYGVGGLDPLVMAAASLVLAGACVMAALVPTAVGLRIEPA